MKNVKHICRTADIMRYRPSIVINYSDLTTWQNYRNILFLQSRVMLEGDFIKENYNDDYGIGEALK